MRTHCLNRCTRENITSTKARTSVISDHSHTGIDYVTQKHSNAHWPHLSPEPFSASFVLTPLASPTFISLITLFVYSLFDLLRSSFDVFIAVCSSNANCFCVLWTIITTSVVGKFTLLLTSLCEILMLRHFSWAYFKNRCEYGKF